MIKSLKFLFNKSIAVKYFSVFIILIVIPIFLIVFIMNNVFLSVLIKNASDKYKTTLEQTVNVIEQEISRMSLITSTIANNAKIIDQVSKYYSSQNQNEKFAISKEIDTNLDFVFNYSNRIDSVIFFYNNYNYYNYKNYLTANEYDIRNKNWFLDSVKFKGKTKVLSSVRNITYFRGDMFVVSVVMGISEIKGNYINLVYMSFRLKFFDDLNYENFIPGNEEYILYDENGEIMLSNNKKNIGKNTDLFFDKKTAETNSIVQKIVKTGNLQKLATIYPIDKTNWRLASIVDYKKITGEINRYYIFEIIILVLIIMFFLLFSYIFFTNLINPVKRLTDKMKQVETGNFNIDFSAEGTNEVYKLAEAFNNMVKEIDKLTSQIKIKEKEKLEAEIEALQFQINPHFISNTLNSIRLMAIMAKTENIQNMSEALMKFMLEIFNYKGRLISIRQELKNLENYIYIMKVRFGDKFVIKYDIQDECYDFLILKVIMQPVIENSILHGLSEKSVKGLISIKIYKSDGNLFIEISDNGKGMEKTAIEHILSDSYINSIRSEKSIGIINVDKRIKLFHGEEYGLSIESIPFEFTKIIYILPVIDGDENV
jgi:two-component system, sensor histidine kinase YesM